MLSVAFRCIIKELTKLHRRIGSTTQLLREADTYVDDLNTYATLTLPRRFIITRAGGQPIEKFVQAKKWRARAKLEAKQRAAAGGGGKRS